MSGENRNARWVKERKGNRRGEKSAKGRGRNRKIKEEERRRRSVDDDNGSGQGAVERGERRERRKIASSEYGRGIRGWKGGREERDYLTVPSREAVEVLIRNAGDHLHGTRSSTPSPPNPPSSLFSRFYPLPPPPPVRLFLLVSHSFPVLSPYFSPSVSVLASYCFLSLFTLLLFLPYRFSHYFDSLYIYCIYISPLYLLIYLCLRYSFHELEDSIINWFFCTMK